MLTLNPPLSALHGARLDHSSAFSRSVLSTLENMSVALLKIQNEILGRLAQRVREKDHQLSPMMVAAVVSDPAIAQLGVEIVKKQVHLSAEVGTHMIALGEWHQHSANAVLANWLAHCQSQWRSLPAGSGMSVMMHAVESVDRSLGRAAGAAAGATEALAEAAEVPEVATRPRRRLQKNR